MSPVELKKYPSAHFPKDKALKKQHLNKLAITVEAPSKEIAASIAFGEFAKTYPAHIDDYFKPKIWEDRPGLPRPPVGRFSEDFFDTVAIWNPKTGEPEPMPADPVANEELAPEKNRAVKKLNRQYQAASIALFGPVAEITPEQYAQIVDLVNDDEPSFTRELAEAIARTPHILALDPERQNELLAHLRDKCKENAQWTDIKKAADKWLDTPAPKREPVNRTPSGANAGGGIHSDRLTPQTIMGLEYEVCLGLLARKYEFNIYNPPLEIDVMANSMMDKMEDKEFLATRALFISMPGYMNYSRACNIATVKTTPEELWQNPVKHREHLNRVMTETDHAHPDELLVDIACGRSSVPMPMRQTEEPTQDTIDDELRAQTDKQLAAGRGEFVPGISDPKSPSWVHESLAKSASNDDEKSEVPPQEDNRQPLTDREIEIAFALNDLLSGHTNVMDLNDVNGVIGCTGHAVSHVTPLLVTDIVSVEYCVLPDLSDDEIHSVATSILDEWSDNDSVREKVAIDAIVEYRRPEPPKAVVIDPQAVTIRPKKEPEPAPADEAAFLTAEPALTYRQQLTLAALRGMCANPAYSREYHEIAENVCHLVNSVIEEESRY